MLSSNEDKTARATAAASLEDAPSYVCPTTTSDAVRWLATQSYEEIAGLSQQIARQGRIIRDVRPEMFFLYCNKEAWNTYNRIRILKNVKGLEAWAEDLKATSAANQQQTTGVGSSSVFAGGDTHSFFGSAAAGSSITRRAQPASALAAEKSSEAASTQSPS